MLRYVTEVIQPCGVPSGRSILSMHGSRVLATGACFIFFLFQQEAGKLLGPVLWKKNLNTIASTSSP